MPSWPPGGGGQGPLGPRLTIWGSNILWGGGGAKAPLPPPLDPRMITTELLIGIEAPTYLTVCVW